MTAVQVISCDMLNENSRKIKGTTSPDDVVLLEGRLLSEVHELLTAIE